MKTNFSKMSKSKSTKSVVRSVAKRVVEDDTSWHSVAAWYVKHLSDEDTYHNKVIKPNLTRLLGDIKGKVFWTWHVARVTLLSRWRSRAHASRL